MTTFEMTIEKLVAGGAGLGRLEGKAIFVPFAAPGDLLEVKLTHDRGDYAEAEIVTLLHPSPERVTPRCPVFGACGGCQWQHFNYPEQLRWKRNIVIETLARISGKAQQELESLVDEVIPSPKAWNYRNRMLIHVDRARRVGFCRTRSHEVVEFEECAIADPSLNRQLQRDRESIRKKGRAQLLTLAGEGKSFSQVNNAMNEVLRETVVSLVRQCGAKKILELFAGSGNFTFPLAEVAEEIVAVELDQRAVKRARQEAIKQGLHQITFLQGDAVTILRQHELQGDLLLFDPPRRGAKEVIEALSSLEIRTIISVSCNPPTFARDMRELEKRGWRLKRLIPLDMFPQTHHIEMVSLFQ